jgi:hypothetical protein
MTASFSFLAATFFSSLDASLALALATFYFS